MGIFSSKTIASPTAYSANAFPIPVAKLSTLHLYGTPASTGPIIPVHIDYNRPSQIRLQDESVWSDTERQMFGYACTILSQALPAIGEIALSDALAVTPFRRIAVQGQGTAGNGGIALKAALLIHPGIAIGTILHELDHIVNDPEPATSLFDRAAREDRAHRNTSIRCTRLIELLQTLPNSEPTIGLKKAVQYCALMNEVGALGHRMISQFFVPLAPPLQLAANTPHVHRDTALELLNERSRHTNSLLNTNWANDKVAVLIQDYRKRVISLAESINDPQLREIIQKSEETMRGLSEKAKVFLRYFKLVQENKE